MKVKVIEEGCDLKVGEEYELKLIQVKPIIGLTYYYVEKDGQINVYNSKYFVMNAKKSFYDFKIDDVPVEIKINSI